jgi:hypothetical protein
MAAKKSMRRAKKVTSSKKAPARNAAKARERVTAFEKRVAKELLGPIERAGESAVGAARRLWLSAESLLAKRDGSTRKSRRKTGTKASR